MASVAILGTGRMGSAMSRALARGGNELVLFNRTPQRCAELAGEVGAQLVATTPAQAAAEAEICITMLADQAAVESVWTGEDGLLSGAREGSVLVDMSTVPPDVIRSFADGARAAGAGILDAPVSGSVTLAESGQLTIMAGGEASDLERVRPVFDQLAKQVFHMGALGSGAVMKLAVNGIVFALNNALSEALVLAELGGIERDLAYEVIASSAVAAPFVGYKRGAFLDPAGTPVAFSLDLAAKDLRLITALANELGVSIEQGHVNHALIRAAAERMGGDRDFAAVASYLRALAEEGRTD